MPFNILRLHIVFNELLLKLTYEQFASSCRYVFFSVMLKSTDCLGGVRSEGLCYQLYIDFIMQDYASLSSATDLGEMLGKKQQFPYPPSHLLNVNKLCVGVGFTT